MPHDVVMPALGMAQETGLIVCWFKKAGDPVEKGEALFSVETDKATMDIEAQASGFLTDVRAREGEELPVGDVVALISERAEDQGMVGHPRKPVVPGALEPPPPGVLTEGTEPSVPGDNHPLLASPKVKRLARDQGLDLGSLVKAGIAQPYHVADLVQARKLGQRPVAGDGTDTAARAVPAPPRHLSALVAKGPFDAFCTWIAEESGHVRPSAVLAAFAAASLRLACARARVVIETGDLEKTETFVDPDWSGLGVLTADQGVEPADLSLRDLRARDLSAICLGTDRAPALNITSQTDQLVITLECTGHQLTINQSLALLRQFTGRLADPRRHIL